MRPMRARAATLLMTTALILLPAPAGAQEECARAVVFTVPGVTWEDVDRHRPEQLMAAIEDGAIGSMSVRTNSARTTYASGFATIGAGTRVDGGEATGGPVDPSASGALLESDVVVAGLEEMKELADRAGYQAVPGALGTALGETDTVAIGNAESAKPPSLIGGYERWPLLAAMDAAGVVDLAATGPDLVSETSAGARTSAAMTHAVGDGLDPPCTVAFIDHGDLIRAEQGTLTIEGSVDEARAMALDRADDFLVLVRDALDEKRDLLLIVSPTSPLEEDAAHFGVAVAVGPGFPAGAVLTSATTRRAGIVTLPDIAPTILAHQGVGRPASMLGRPFHAVSADADRIAAALELDLESTFVDEIRTPVWTVYVILQLLVYGVIAYHLWRRRRSSDRVLRHSALEVAALALLSLPVATFLIGGFSGHSFGSVGYVAVLIGINGLLTGIVWWRIRDPLDRVLAISALTTAVLLVDLVAGSRLQVNTVFGSSPIVAGRFSGIGNIGFGILGAAVILTAALTLRKLGSRRAGLTFAAILFAVTVFIDGAPSFGSDVGGTLALVPSFGLAWLLLAGRRPGLKAVIAGALGAVIAVGAFLAWDLSLPEESRTHLGRLFEDVTSRGGEVFFDTIERKIRANLRVFTSTIWTYLVPPLLLFVGWLLLRPEGRWARVAERHPAFRAGIVGGLILCVLGFAVNDSGIVVPAIILSMLVPAALIVHLMLERESTG